MSTATRNEPPKWYQNPIIIAALITATAAIIAPIITFVIVPAIQSCRLTTIPLTVTITSPVDNAVIKDESFQLKGQVNKELAAGEFLYAVVQDKTSLWWPERILPRYSEVSKSYEFDCTLWIKNTGTNQEIFTIKVVLTNEVIHHKFQDWQSNCIAHNEWPGIPIESVNTWGVWQTKAEVTIIY
jgi:hypothetical protein